MLYQYVNELFVVGEEGFEPPIAAYILLSPWCQRRDFNPLHHLRLRLVYYIPSKPMEDYYIIAEPSWKVPRQWQ